MDFIDHYALSLLIFVPIITGAITFVVPSVSAAKYVSMGSSLLSLLIAAHVWYYFDGTTADLQFVEAYEWIPSLGMKYIVGIDGISLLLVVLTAFLTPLILLSQWHIDEKRQNSFLALFQLLQGGIMGSLLAIDMFFFYIFWEAMLIPMYFIIGIWGGKRRVYAATKFVIYTVAGSLLMLAALIGMYLLHFQQFGAYSTSLLDLYRITTLKETQMWLFGAFALAFAIKVPLWPFHTWLPDAHVEAPTAGSVILAGVLLKLGTYGLLRFAIPLFPQAVAFYAPAIVGLSIVGIIYGALTAWVQKDAKKLVAYSSVSHLGFVVLGCFALVGKGTLDQVALNGAVIQMINHGISTGALFFLVGIIYEKRHTRQLADFGGIASVMPWFSTFLIIATLGSIGLPGTGGFVGEFMILLGTFQNSPFAAVMASLGVLLGAIYMLTLCRKVLFGPLNNEENKSLNDLNAREFAYLTPLAILIIAMGIFPDHFMSKSKASIEHLATSFQNYRIFYQQVADNDRPNFQTSIETPSTARSLFDASALTQNVNQRRQDWILP